MPRWSHPPGPAPGRLPHLHHRTPVGRGRDAFETAGAAVTEWRMHRVSGARMDASAARAEAAATVRVSLGIGPVRFTAPCEVVWTAYEKNRTGFGHGTRAGHPECGEESFVVELADDGTVWFTVMAFSARRAVHTARRAARAGDPAVVRAQARPHLAPDGLGRVRRRAAFRPPILGAMEWFTADVYWLSRLIFQRALAVVYLVAFVGAALQFRALIGERGMLPVPELLRRTPWRAAPGCSGCTTATGSSRSSPGPAARSPSPSSPAWTDSFRCGRRC
ncbi:DUF1990 domain-containing protein [Streptomyces sp. M10(2022)]